MEFSGNLSHLMEINSTSVSELARFVGVSRQAVLGWKNGSIPTKDKIMKIAEYYNKSIGYFGFEEDEDIHDGEIPVVGSIQAGYPVESFKVQFIQSHAEILMILWFDVQKNYHVHSSSSSSLST